MKNTSSLLGAIAAVTGAASIYLGMQLSTVRDELAAQGAARVADAARIRELEDRLARAQAMRTDAPSRAAADAAAHAAPAPPAERRAEGPPPWGPGGRNLASVYATPAGQNEWRVQQEIRLRRLYADLPSVLGLDAVTAGKVYDVLADAQINSNSQPFGRFGSPSLDDAARAQRDAQLEALLGPEKAAEFQSFEKSIPARMQVGRIGESMAAANVPLSEAQRNSLIAAVYDQQQATPPPQRTPDMSDAEYQAKYLDWQADYSSRVQAAVEPLLNGQQVTRYQEAVQVQDARRADMRARAEARRNAASPK